MLITLEIFSGFSQKITCSEKRCNFQERDGTDATQYRNLLLCAIFIKMYKSSAWSLECTTLTVVCCVVAAAAATEYETENVE